MISSTWKQLVFSNSTQRSACCTWKGINHHAIQARRPFCFILECIILSCPISCHLAPVQLLPPLRLDMSACWLRLMDVWQLDILVSPDRLCLVTEVFLSSLSDASGSAPVTRPGFRFLVSFPHRGIACRARSICSESCCWARPHPERSGVFSGGARRMFRSHCLCGKKQSSQRMLVSLQFPTHGLQADRPWKWGFRLFENLWTAIILPAVDISYIFY